MASQDNLRRQVALFADLTFKQAQILTSLPVTGSGPGGSGLRQRSGALHQSLQLHGPFMGQDESSFVLTASAVNPETGFPYAYYHEHAPTYRAHPFLEPAFRHVLTQYGIPTKVANAIGMDILTATLNGLVLRHGWRWHGGTQVYKSIVISDRDIAV